MPQKFFSLNAALQTALEAALEQTWEAFASLAPNQIAVTWIVYEPPYQVNTGGALSAEAFWQYRPAGASYRGVELVEPGTLAHLFYLVAIQGWLEQGMVPSAAEIERAMAAMIGVDGAAPSCEAASFIMDVLSGTTSGPGLTAGPYQTWSFQRNIVNRYFGLLNWPELRSLNLNQKTWHDGPYGRERDFLGQAMENRNALSTEATARLLHSLVGGVSVSRARSQAMMQAIARPAADVESANLDLTSIQQGLPADAQIWSSFHRSLLGIREAAYVELASAHPFLLSIFAETKGGGTVSKQSLLNTEEIAAVVTYLTRQLVTELERHDGWKDALSAEIQ